MRERKYKKGDKVYYTCLVNGIDFHDGIEVGTCEIVRVSKRKITAKFENGVSNTFTNEELSHSKLEVNTFINEYKKEETKRLKDQLKIELEYLNSDIENARKQLK